MSENTNTTVSEPVEDLVLPDWARDQITKANAEAAKYRTEKKDAVEAAKAEVTASFTAKIEELEAQIKAKEEEGTAARYEVDRLKVALEAGINADKVTKFAGLLNGSSTEELKAHAEELKELFVNDEHPVKRSPAVDPSQGTGSVNPLPLNGDPLLAAVMKAIGK